MGGLFPSNFGRENVQSQNAIPNQVIFLAPGVRPVKSETKVIIVGGHLYPMRRMTLEPIRLPAARMMEERVCLSRKAAIC